MILVLVLATFLVYLPNINAFFQQDEWLAFSRLLILKYSSIGSIFANIFTPTSGHYTPLNLFFIFGEFLLFGLNFKGYMVVSIILHCINTFLIYKLANILIKNKYTSLIIALVFGVLASTFQATSWVIADAGTHLATIFTLTGLIYLAKFLDGEKKKYFITSIICLIISLFFKEISIANFVVFVMFVLIFFGKKVKRLYIMFPGIALLIFVGFRFLLIKMASNTTSTSGLVFDKNNFIYNFVTIPMKAFVQSIVPYNFLLDISEKIGNKFIQLFGVNYIPGTWQYDVFIENTVFEVLNIFLFITITIFIAVYVIKRWKSKSAKLILAFYIFSILNGFIFGLSPERAGRISIVDSRSLYLLSIGSVLVIVLILKDLLNKKIFYFLMIIYIMINMYLISIQTRTLIEVGKTRKSIIDEVVSKYPDIGDKTVFYFQSDREYFGLSYKLLPFQSGFGQTLLINYFERENYHTDFLRNQFLWDIKSQGYKEINGKGFGFFVKEEELMSSLGEYRIKPEEVISFSWENEVLVDKTNEIRGKINKVSK